MMKLSHYLFDIGFLFLISSCDPYGGYEYSIDNRSDVYLDDSTQSTGMLGRAGDNYYNLVLNDNDIQ